MARRNAMKWLIVLLVGLSILIPIGVGAQPPPGYADVTVTASPYFFVLPPQGFFVYYISDYEVGIEWTKPAQAENTLIRAAIGRLPTDRDDGYLVYYGTGTNTTDKGVSLDETLAPTFYRAWSQRDDGHWEEIGASDLIEGVGVILGILGLIAVVLMIAGFVRSQGLLLLGSGIFWILFGAIAYIRPDLGESMRNMIFLAGLSMSIVSFAWPLVTWQMKGDRRTPAEKDYDSYRQEVFNTTRRRR